jgi:hypothetical protein
MEDHQQYHFEPQHLQMQSADEHDQQLGSPLLGLDPFGIEKMKLKFHPLNPFNPLRIPGAAFSNFHAGRIGGLHFGNALLGAENPMAEEHQSWGADAQNLGAPQQAEYNYQLQQQEPQHYQLQAQQPAEYSYHLQEQAPQHYQLQAPQPADYHLQAPPMPQHYQVQAPQPAEYHLQAPPMPQHYQVQAPQPAEYQVQAPMMIDQVPFPQGPVIPESHQLEGPQAEDGSRHWKGWNKKG